jgi:DNA-binding NtrC family response regulator
MDRESLQERFGIVGPSAALRHVIDRVRQVAETDITVLIQGESGVGKELIAEACHALSRRRHEELVVVNCGAIPEGLMESELFGAEKGAYTGAVEKRKGYFEEADGSTVFLDEIGEMPQKAQVRLLRVLEDGAFSRVGASTTQQTDVRIVAATNKDLAREVEEGRFREDLYYRLSTVLIDVPPLRERAEDILPILEHFLHRLAQKYGTPMRRLSDEAERLLTEYEWPGNVRELRNVAEQVVVLTQDDTVGADALRPFLRGVAARPESESLLPVKQEEAEQGGTREREMVYRALLEMRVEMRELKEKVSRLVEQGGAQVPTAEVAEREGDLVLVRSEERGGDREHYESIIEDVPYELEDSALEGDEPAPSSARPEGEDAGTEQASGGNGREEEPLPTLEDAERRLIADALQRFDGNRRRTAQALGISERTLYRKLKDMDEEL